MPLNGSGKNRHFPGSIESFFRMEKVLSLRVLISQKVDFSLFCVYSVLIRKRKTQDASGTA